MKKWGFVLWAVTGLGAACWGQGSRVAETRPRIVIGLVVDQMRWDYLYRFEKRYGAGGFRRLMAEGFNCRNTMIDHSPTVTACGHTCIYTGSVPAITGIIGNDWYDRYRHRSVYCTEDTTVKGVGGNSAMGPANLLVTTIGDEMEMANNFQGKVVGIALKDRAAILPAGHTATAAFWMDWQEGNWVSSTYYMRELPDWVRRFNEPANKAKYYRQDWETVYPLATYTQSTADDEDYEAVSPGEERPVFPHKVKGGAGAIRATPFGDALTLDFARAAIKGYGLGSGGATDLLAISLSSPDAVGHQYGPNSVEIEDVYLRLDRELADFFDFLDRRFGKGRYLLFLTADHGVASSPGYSLEHRMPAGALDVRAIVSMLNDSLLVKYGVAKGIEGVTDLELYLNREAFETRGLSVEAAESYLTDLLERIPGVARAIPTGSLGSVLLPAVLKNKLINGYNARRSGDLIIVPEPGWKAGSLKGADHGLIYPYDTHIPLVFMGWGIAHGATDRPIGMEDIAPTIASMLHVQMPSGCIGQPIGEITR